jgi:hypothetical protein
MKPIKILLAVSLVALAAAPVVAQSLEAKKMYLQQETELAGKVEFTNKACGGALKAKIEWSTFNADEILKKSVVSWCEAALGAIEDLCADALGKQAVNEKVKVLTCAGAAEPSAKLTDGNLLFSFSLTPNENKLLVRTYLEKNL